MRVVSLLPSSTEVIAALGHGDDLVGRSHECDHPAAVSTLPVVSRPRRAPVGTSADIHRGVVDLLTEVLSIYEVDAEALRRCDPDLVVTQDLCRVCAVAESEVEDAVRAHLDHDVRIVTCSPLTLGEVLDDVERVAEALGDRDAGAGLRAHLADGFERVRVQASGGSRARTAVVEWADPLMGCGNWAPELIELAGGEPVLATRGGHTPFVEREALAAADPEVVVIGPCGYDLARAVEELPLLQALPGWSDLAAVRSGRVAFIDGSAYLNRPGPRLLDTAEILASILDGRADRRHGQGWCWLAELTTSAG